MAYHGDHRHRGDFRDRSDHYHHHRGSRLYHPQHARLIRDTNVDRISDFVARRLVPEIQRGSDLPVQFVMNFGTLFVQDNNRGEKFDNTVVYNAPDSTLVLGSGPSTQNNGGPGSGSLFYPNALDLAMPRSYGRNHLRLCIKCGTQMTEEKGRISMCRDCELDLAVRAADRAAAQRKSLEYISFPERRAISYAVPSRW